MQRVVLGLICPIWNEGQVVGSAESSAAAVGGRGTRAKTKASILTRYRTPSEPAVPKTSVTSS